VLVSSLLAGPVPVAGHSSRPPAVAPHEQSADLAPALGLDGTFRGAPGVAGTVDTSAWTLVSDLAVGEPPRFAPAGSAVSAVATPIGPWSSLGSNGAEDGAVNNVVRALAVSGTDLYVGGSFTNAAGIATADYVAKWNGSAWSALGSDGAGNGAINDQVLALAVSGSDVYVGGVFTNAAGIAEADYVARSNGSAWSALGSDFAADGALDGGVAALVVSGSDLYVGGLFTNAAAIFTADFVAKWNGSAWSALGSNGAGNGALSSYVYALAASGSDLYVGGAFLNAAGLIEADHVAKWNGSAWSALGSNGAGNGALAGEVHALAVSGGDLYVGGLFFNAAGIAEADAVAKWNGSAWSALGSDGAGEGALNDWVLALAISGNDLFVGGFFQNAAGIATADYVAKWELGARYVSLTPARILDTRISLGLSGVFHSGVARTFAVTGQGGVPAGAIAVTGNLTVTEQTSPGFVALTPEPTNNPPTSTLNFPTGDNRANGVTVALSGTGTLSATYLGEAGPTATTQLIFDVTGYFVS
jgi:hypothetical protein